LFGRKPLLTTNYYQPTTRFPGSKNRAILYFIHIFFEVFKENKSFRKKRKAITPKIAARHDTKTGLSPGAGQALQEGDKF
jgi:hypothetical protein